MVRMVAEVLSCLPCPASPHIPHQAAESTGACLFLLTTYLHQWYLLGKGL